MNKHEERPWRILSSQVVYERGFQIVEERLETPAGEMLYVHMRSPVEAVATVALTGDHKVILTRQYRHPLGRWIYDLPAGSHRIGEDPKVGALRELEEETGFTTDNIIKLGYYVPFPGSLNVGTHLFLARDLVPGSRSLDKHEFINLVYMDFDEALQRVLDGEFTDGALMMGLLLTAQKGLTH